MVAAKNRISDIKHTASLREEVFEKKVEES